MNLPDGAWYDAQYNNRQRVADSAAQLARWTEASALTRGQMTVVPDQAYGDSPAETLDVFPARSPQSPVLVFIHGGYWRSLDKADHSFVAPAFVQSGAMVVVPNYGLSPAVGMDQIALQCARVLAWTWRHAERFGGDPQRIVVAGHSAGGHLAAMLLACRWRQVSPELPRRLVGAGLTPPLVRRLSPAFFPRPAGPLVALVGGDESSEFLRQNQLIRDQWGPSTVPVCEALPGFNHFSVLTDLVDPAGRAHGHALRLLGLRP
jgi:arylformamidase